MAKRENGPRLSFHDDPMFKRVMEREDICKGVIERVLGMPVGKVEYLNTEQERRLGPTGKTVRMDSYLVESGGDGDGLGRLLEYVYTGRVPAGDSLVESIDSEVMRYNDDRGWIMAMIDSITIAEQEAGIRGKLKGFEEGHGAGLEEGLRKGQAKGENR